MKKIHLLLAARPDHSMQIYQALSTQSGISYLYTTFKFLPCWIRRFIKNKRAHFSQGNVSNSYLMTIHNYLSYNRNIKFLIKIPEQSIFEHHLSKVLKLYAPQLIHYWPIYCYEKVHKYRLKHPDVKTVAEIYMINSRFILDEVESLMKSLNLDANLDYIRKEEEKFEKIMKVETDFMVPSSIVADSYRKYYPDKHFHILSFGITVPSSYKKKTCFDPNKRFSFVYCGTISVEKGCDILCSWFARNNNYEINLFGSIKSSESHLFKQYASFSNIRFRGHVPKSELQNLLGEFDAGIHLSRFDAYSLAVGEVIGSGLPTIVSDRTGNMDDILKYGMGIVTSLDEQSVTNAIHKISSADNYVEYVSNIDNYIKSVHKPYGQRVVEYYQTWINR